MIIGCKLSFIELEVTADTFKTSIDLFYLWFECLPLEYIFIGSIGKSAVINIEVTRD